ncbi:hypothetical protein BdWA1_001337 [Babesia duncani]|uniref:Uncharacterized protein n=1 Tax=Babesia duncani TaxID=323732 RepID=A0AAD9UQQ0_9APIC|nr:hypothetical protein BdWA1_001337 [Babesia duncani]
MISLINIANALFKLDHGENLVVHFYSNYTQKQNLKSHYKRTVCFRNYVSFIIGNKSFFLLGIPYCSLNLEKVDLHTTNHFFTFAFNFIKFS